MLEALAAARDPALDRALREAVAAVAASWAAQVVVGVPVVFSAEPAGAAAADLAERLTGHAGPLVLVAPDVPRLDAALAAAALGDLAAGCAVSFAPATDGRPFLLAFAAATPAQYALLSGAERRRDDMLAAALALGGEVGLLRSERRVATPADARALAADPLVAPELRALARAAAATR